MFVYYFVHLNAPFEAVEPRLLAMVEGRLDALAGAAYRHGEEIRARIGAGHDARLLAKTVRLHVGEARRGAVETTIPLSWEATGTPGVFPRLDADLIVGAVAGDLSHITLRGTYEPPLGRVGLAADRLALHRVAEASVKAFLDRVAAALAPSGAAMTDAG